MSEGAVADTERTGEGGHREHAPPVAGITAQYRFRQKNGQVSYAEIPQPSA
jgi:hypothetical protein